MGAEIYDQETAEAYVQACGVTPADNYLVLKKRMGTARLFAGMMFSQVPEDDMSRSNQEDNVLLVFTADELVSVNLTRSPKPGDVAFSPERIARTEVTNLAVDPTSDQFCLHFEVRGQRRNYYVWMAQRPETQYVLVQFNALQANHFLGWATAATAGTPVATGRVAAPTMPSARDLMRSRRVPNFGGPTPKSEPVKPKPAETTHPSAPTQHDDVSTDYRPERTHKSWFKDLFGGPKRS